MNWKIVRLELAQCRGSSRASASKAYLLRVPLDVDGRIDAEAIASNPARATVARFWASEPDMHGRVERENGHWRLRWLDKAGQLARIPAVPLRLNERVSIEGPGGSEAFSVASINDSGRQILERP
ncbi:hypothetical protein [Sphingomonas daechungensis]|uniref:hypothetical protein n=1 Tax=Sphingomonas daechungensis TaxID=1176646 RepID=UPI0037837843